MINQTVLNALFFLVNLIFYVTCGDHRVLLQRIHMQFRYEVLHKMVVVPVSKNKSLAPSNEHPAYPIASNRPGILDECVSRGYIH